MIIETKKAEEIAKEAVWIAWQAVGGTSGLGFLQNNSSADKEAVWKNVINMGDYPGNFSKKGEVNADYVFGKMMKLYFRYDKKTLEIPDRECRRDYQAWCSHYKTYKALFLAAARNLGEELPI